MDKVALISGGERLCAAAVKKVVKQFGRLDILVNNVGEQIQRTSSRKLPRAAAAHVSHGMFYLTQTALPHLGPDAAIVNTPSITAFRGSATLIDYSATKGAIVAFHALAGNAAGDQGIRVNAVAPGPIWTPLIAASFDAKRVSEFGAHTPMKRPGQPDEVAPSYVFLASQDANYMTGQALHPNGGEIVA